MSKGGTDPASYEIREHKRHQARAVPAAELCADGTVVRFKHAAEIRAQLAQELKPRPKEVNKTS